MALRLRLSAADISTDSWFVPTVVGSGGWRIQTTHRLLSSFSSFLGLPYRILKMSQQKGTTKEPMGRVSASKERTIDST